MYPLIPSKGISDLPIISAFKFLEGGCFLRNENLTDSHRMQLINAMAKLVEFSVPGKQETSDKKLSGTVKAVYMAVPDILVH